MSCPISDNSFEDCIPHSVRREIKHIIKKTKDKKREQSLTLCKLSNNDKIFVSDYTSGSLGSTDVLPCNRLHGNTMKVGDVHSHPDFDSKTIGITPSTSDMVSTILDSVQNKFPQISCIVGTNSKHISCYQAKKELLDNPEKIKNYKKALYYPEEGITDISPYIRENIGKDFNHAWYDVKSFKRVTPSPKEIVNDALVKSKKFLKFEGLDPLQKGIACDLIQDLNYPTDNRVGEECRKTLHINEFFGIRY